MKRLMIIGVIIALLATSALFCLPKQEELQITDDFGRTITIKENPERIVSLSPTNTEILFAVGAGNKVVGVTEYCNYPEEVKEMVKIGVLRQ